MHNLKYLLLYLSIAHLNDNATATKRPNVVLILTDDQDINLGGLTPMHKTLSLIANQGATLQNFFVNTPICCPSRSTILTGRYQHNHGVLNNSLNGNCAGPAFIRDHEPYTVGALLQRNGYDTFYAGKYLNEYGAKGTAGLKRVPIGWDRWHGLKGNSKYYDYTLSIDGVAKRFVDYYFTDYITKVAVDYIDGRTGTKPFFMMLAPPAPHAPFTPAPRHRGRYAGVKALRNPSFNHTPVAKHWLMQMQPISLPTDVKVLDDIQQRRFETLLAVDEMVDGVVSHLDSVGVLNDTYVIFTSDHGFHIGQFGQPWDKRQPYETDVRVPFFVRGPNVPAKRLLTVAQQCIDIAPTVLEMAGVRTAAERMDGVSFYDRLVDGVRPVVDVVRNVFVEYFGEGGSRSNDPYCYPYGNDDTVSECVRANWCKCQDSVNNTYACVRRISASSDFKYCEFLDSKATVEAYNLTSDPYELVNIYERMDKAAAGKYNLLLQRFRNCTLDSCRNI